VNSDEVPEEILNAVLSKLKESMQKYSCPEAMNFVFREQIVNTFRNIDAAVNEDILLSRLEREEMDKSFYEQITNNEELKRWKLEFYDEIPDKLLPQFIEFTRLINDDIASRNPYSPKMYLYTIESWKKNLENFGNSNTFCFMFDSEGNIAGLSWVLSYPEYKSTLQHNGGLTAVEPKYRQKGIAKFLKAKLYLKLLKENKDFKYITTDSMPWNKFMYRINEEFGFKPYRKGTSFKLTEDFLKNYLNCEIGIE
jgi:GNAT superfamily N-acetyltransferase